MKDHCCSPCFFRRVWKRRVLLTETRLLEWWWQPEKQSAWPLLSRENSWTADIFINYVFAQLHRWALKLYNKSPAFQCTHQALSVTLLKTFRITRSLSVLVTNGPVCFLIHYFTYCCKGKESLGQGELTLVLNPMLYLWFFHFAEDLAWLLREHVASSVNGNCCCLAPVYLLG